MHNSTMYLHAIFPSISPIYPLYIVYLPYISQIPPYPYINEDKADLFSPRRSTRNTSSVSVCSLPVSHHHHEEFPHSFFAARRMQRPYILTRRTALDHFLLNISFFVQEEELFLYIAAFVKEEEIFPTSCTVACQTLQLRFVT